MKDDITKQEVSEPGTALVLPKPKALEAILKDEKSTKSLLDQIVAAGDEEFKSLSAETKKGRDALVALASKASASRAEAKRQALALTEKWRKDTAAVNRGRKQLEDGLADARDKWRKPVTDWEVAEEARKTALRERMKVFDKSRTTFNMSVAEIGAVIAEVEAVEVEEGWDELKAMASDAKSDALEKFRGDLNSAEVREEQQRQIEKLKQEAAAREAREAEEKRAREAKESEERRAREQKEAQERADREEQARIDQEKQDRIQREEMERQRLAEEHAAKQQAASDIMDHISGCGAGKIGPDDQPLGLIQYELEKKIPAEIEKLLDDDKKRVDQHRLATLEIVNHRANVAAEEAEKQRQAEREQAEKDAAARATREAAERQEEADRQAAEELEKLKADENHRAKLLTEITDALEKHKVNEMAAAIFDGKIPHVQVVF